jgi:DNA-binding PadR family transcriptional regulator
MAKDKDDWGLHNLNDLFGFDAWPGGFSFWADGWTRGSKRRRKQMFESGEVKFVILRLLREKPRHGYDIIKELEDRFGGCYTPSAGTVYPTLQLLEDQGYVRVEEQDGKKTYHITPEGERFLEENSHLIDDILDRVRDTVHGFTGGRMGELHSAFARLASVTYKRAWRYGPHHPALDRVVEILRQSADDIERAWDQG